MQATSRLTAGVGIFLISCGVLSADEAEDAFQAQFGAEFKKVAATPQTADDVALAAGILEAANAEGVRSALAVVFCEKAHELGAKAPAGYDTAIEAMERAADLAKDKAPVCLEKVIALRRKKYAAVRASDAKAKKDAGAALVEAMIATAGARIRIDQAAEADALAKQALALGPAVGMEKKDIQDRLDGFKARREVEKRLAELKAKVQADPKDTAARNELVRLLVAEFDDPKQANLYLDETCEATLRKYVPASAKPLAAVPADAALELAKWYEGLAKASQDPVATAAMLTRAAWYCWRSIEKGSPGDPGGPEAKLALGRINDQLTKSGPANAVRVLGAGASADLVPLWDPGRYLVRGSWPRGPRGISGGGSYDRLAFPCVIQGSYELSCRLIRTHNHGDSSGPIGFILPVGTSTVVFVSSDTRGELEYVKGQRWRVTSSGTPVGEREHTVDITVLLTGDQASLAFNVDGVAGKNWTGPVKDLSYYVPWQLPLRGWPGVGGHGVSLTVRSARLKMLDGKAYLLSQPALP